MLTTDECRNFQMDGHVTVPDVLSLEQVNAAIRDIESWSSEFRRTLDSDQHRWYLEKEDPSGAKLRKLDNPVATRPLFRGMASDAAIVSKVEQLIGKGVSVFFSQVFLKPPEIGGPKPVHQDNFYFGPDDPEATLTVWIALDAANVKNGCLFYCNGSHLDGVLPHVAPSDEPFNLQIPESVVSRRRMTPAPVAAGGISFHHGATWHQSSHNTSQYPRRAVAMHYLRNSAKLSQPALSYDPDLMVRIT